MPLGKFRHFLRQKWILIVLPAFLLSRLILLWYSPYIFHGEEVKEASLGIDLLKGELSLPFWAYIDSPHAGGSILAGLANLPFYVLFGPIYLAQKMCALFFSTLVFLLAIFFLTQEYGKKIIIPTSLLFIFPTPQYLRFSFFNLGNKNEAVLFILLALLLTFKIFGKKEKKRSHYIWLGLVCGFGMWVNYLMSAILVVVGGWWLVRDKLLVIKKEFWYFLGAFLIGLTPFLLYNFQYSFASFNSDQVINANLWIQPFPDSLLKIACLLSVFLPHSFQIQNVSWLGAQLASWLVYGIFLSASFAILRQFRQDKKPSLGLFLVCFVVTSLLMISFTRTRIGGIHLLWGEIESYKFEYLYFFQPIFLMITGIVLGTLLAARNTTKKKVGYVLLTILLVILGGNYFRNLQFSSPPNSRLLNSNYDISTNAYEAGFSYAQNRAFFKVAAALPEGLRQPFLSGSGVSWFHYLKTSDFSSSDKDLFFLQLGSLSSEEKKWYLASIVQGETYTTPEANMSTVTLILRGEEYTAPETDFQTKEKIYRYLLLTLDESEQIILQEVFRERAT